VSVVVIQARSPGGMLYRKCRSDLDGHYYDRHWCFDDKPPEFITEDEFELALALYGED
jgi:hypothetical protein